jgi:hypothetical protein
MLKPENGLRYSRQVTLKSNKNRETAQHKNKDMSIHTRMSTTAFRIVNYHFVIESRKQAVYSSSVARKLLFA